MVAAVADVMRVAMIGMCGFRRPGSLRFASVTVQRREHGRDTLQRQDQQQGEGEHA